MKASLRRILCIVLTLLSLPFLTPSARAEIDYLAYMRQRNAYNSIITQSRDAGTCRMLRGSIELTVVVVGMDGVSWTLGELNTLGVIVNQALDTLEEEAALYGTELQITPVFYRAASSADPDEDGWFLNVLDSVPELADASWVNRPLLFCLNIEGRSYALTSSGSTPEHVIFFMDNDTGTVRHELLHLFGAEDFYFHDDVEAAAERHFPDSVMLNSDADAVTDPLTAYLVGWTSTPNETAQAFLADISHLTQEDIDNARAVDQQSGLGAFELESGMYYGMLEMGCANGLGLHQWESGMSYVGQWVWNSFEGRGTFTWPDGDYYTGDFSDDKRNGKGTYVWSSGTTYTGDFVDGERTGKGTISWPGGDSYTGDFINGKRTGQGTFTWADGRSYTGAFKEDAITGLGMMTFTNGDIYMGEFVDGTLHGMGTMYYADGTVKTGKWENDVYVGE